MGSLTLFLLIAGFSLVFFAYLFYRYIYKRVYYFKDLGIPGPKPKPLVGNFDLFGKFDGNFGGLTDYVISKYGPVSGLLFGLTPTYIIADLDLIKEITVKQFGKFVDRLNQNANILSPRVDGKLHSDLFTSRGEEWRKRRHVLSPSFSGHKMKLMEPLIRESTSRLAEKIQEAAESKGTVEVLQLYNKMTMEVILSTAFGRSVDVQGGNGGELFEAAANVMNSLTPSSSKKSMQNRIFQMLSFFQIAFPFLEPILLRIVPYLEVGQSVKFLHKSASSIINARKEQAAVRKDLLQLMIDASNSSSEIKYETGDILSDSVTFILAGYETTSTTLAFITYLLALHTEVQERLANEIHEYLLENPEKSMYDASHELQYLDMVIRESLRMYSPAFLTIRHCNEDCVINDVKFKKGCSVWIAIDSIHRSPTVWKDPEVFNPERFAPEEKAHHHPCAFMPFGVGPRNCIGFRFALLEAKMALIEVVNKFKIVMSPETKIPLDVETGNVLKPKSGVFVKFEPRMWSNDCC